MCLFAVTHVTSIKNMCSIILYLNTHSHPNPEKRIVIYWNFYLYHEQQTSKHILLDSLNQNNSNIYEHIDQWGNVSLIFTNNLSFIILIEFSIVSRGYMST